MNDTAKNASRGSVLYLSHGGGPLPLLGDGAHREMIAALKEIAPLLGSPSAIVVVSAHWEEGRPTVTGGASPGLIYDYYGFPEESYRIAYPAPGEPALANKIAGLLQSHGFDAKLDEQCGFDHGLFVPLKILYPEAAIPCVQLSLVNSLRPDEHIRIGRALAGLTNDNILVIGSGFSFHNLRAFFAPSTPEARSMNEAFEQWLVLTCSSREISEAERERRLVNWENAPAARYCHPREEHLLPLHVCYGVAGLPAGQVFRFEIMGKKASAYLW
ncbi:class III extradiol ring-cleavage dioxygenase [Methylomicrobium sp. Wu6]|uniref:DODA-type extradiol aromatic ring-opening family dioxygenase n=1 Tax=Methylomicrobium sp. Wu6 TaxID=3107928 RepID=UPI002DD65EEE|nr:class III extradiol ring-cleavage dioxygenase [Methylomicrobium sp. Wu6]MEC4750323.1 class III extradiol ring-cleavage dioxygenase [Methylomicrobium sp. Wu6]